MASAIKYQSAVPHRKGSGVIDKLNLRNQLVRIGICAHGKIIAVGTTSVRTLETVISKNDKFVPSNDDTNIFIYPGFTFRAIDGLITNFHLPKSTLVMLVSAFSSKENIMNAYQEAIKHNYRFFSFGDAMFIK